MIDPPVPADMTGRYDCTYDGWDRLASV